MTPSFSFRRIFLTAPPQPPLHSRPRPALNGAHPPARKRGRANLALRDRGHHSTPLRARPVAAPPRPPMLRNEGYGDLRPPSPKFDQTTASRRR